MWIEARCSADRAAEAVPICDVPGTYRPDVIQGVLPHLGAAGAVGAAEIAKLQKSFNREVTWDISANATLHVVSVGVSQLKSPGIIKNLKFAHQDALDIASLLKTTQTGTYAGVNCCTLVDDQATKDKILSSG